MEIFGNEIRQSVYDKALRTQKKFIRKFGDDRNKEYHLELKDNPVLTPPFDCRIIVTNPEDRNYFTDEECQLTSGEPYKSSDQDTYEQLMTMEDKEIKFWMEYDLTPPFIEECKMGTWEQIKSDYIKRKEEEKRLGIDVIREKFDAIIAKLTISEISDLLEEGIIPDSLNKITNINPITGDFVCKEYPDITLATLANMVDILEDKNKMLNESFEIGDTEIADVV